MMNDLFPGTPPPRHLVPGVYDMQWRRIEKPIPGVTDRNGLCPECRKHGTGVNEGRQNWMVCLDCKTKWSIGHNLVTTHPEEWERLEDITAELAKYRDVEPVHIGDGKQRDGRVYQLVGEWIWSRGFLGETSAREAIYQRIAAIVPIELLDKDPDVIKVHLQ